MNQTELILNTDGSVYHLSLLPDEIAPNVILVGDPERVDMVAQYFDEITVIKKNREFVTRTGTYNDIPVSVISTGIGTDNIDIVLNELDALVNIDLQTKEVKKELTSLNIVRIGTSGCLDELMDVDTFLLSEFAIGLDGLLNYYQFEGNEIENTIQAECQQMQLVKQLGITPYVVQASTRLFHQFFDDNIFTGITCTSPGFYAPQGRTLRLQPKVPSILDEMTAIEFSKMKITNFEMETAGIYGLAKLLGHEAISFNLLIANRATGIMSKNKVHRMMDLIQWVLSKL